MQFGEQLALSAAFVWSVAVILIRLSGLELGALPLTIFKSGVATLAFLITTPFLSSAAWPQLSWHEWSILFLSGILGISIADTMVVAALNRLGASLHALADCLYTPSMALMGYLLFRESLNGWEVVGGMLVIGGVAFGMRLTKEVPSIGALLSGLALAAVEMALAAGTGATLDIPMRPHVLLFAEDQARYVVATGEPDRLMAAALQARIGIAPLGTAGGDHLTVPGVLRLSLDALRQAHEGWLPTYMSRPA